MERLQEKSSSASHLGQRIIHFLGLDYEPILEMPTAEGPGFFQGPDAAAHLEDARQRVEALRATIS